MAAATGELTGARYSFPNTSDKRDDETWVASFDRKRHEAHGKLLVRLAPQ